MDQTHFITPGENPAEPDQQPDRQAMPVDREEVPHLPFPVVGIGVSAGGLEAFTEFFKAMPPDSGMAFVLIQHLPPDRESMVSEILSRHTAMKVQQVHDNVAVEPRTEALEAYQKSRPQILLSDIGLPDFDGYVLLSKIRGIDARQNLPPPLAIALTAYARDIHKKNAADAGYTVHITKPVDLEKLLITIATLVRSR